MTSRSMLGGLTCPLRTGPEAMFEMDLLVLPPSFYQLRSSQSSLISSG